jgi:hypothetical protein
MRTPIALAALFFAACSDSPTGAGSAARCATTDGVEICTARAEYRPSDVVDIQIRNEGLETRYVDYCSVKIVGTTSRSAPFPEDYSPQVRCGSDWTQADIIANKIELPPGGTVQESQRIQSFAFQGYYRVNVWLVDENGDRIGETPSYSGTFEVFPSAGS